MANETTTKQVLVPDKFKKLLKLNDCVKIITQVSWDLKLVTQEFPIKDINNDKMYGDYVDLLEDKMKDFLEAVTQMNRLLNE